MKLPNPARSPVPLRHNHNHNSSSEKGGVLDEMPQRLLLLLRLVMVGERAVVLGAAAWAMAVPMRLVLVVLVNLPLWLR